MLHAHMARGESGRIVIEVEPELKRRLYATLALSGSSLKDWFIVAASRFCDDALQADLFGGTEPQARERTNARRR